MNLPQALAIVKDHIRIGKGMELTNGVPEALEMVARELEVTQKALELACIKLTHSSSLCPAFLKKDPNRPTCLHLGEKYNCSQCWHDYFLAQAKGGNDETEQASGDY